MLYDEKHFERTDSAGAVGGGGGFLFLRPAESMKTLPFDELRWPYRFSPIQAYLCGVVTIWSLFVVYHVITFAIAANKRSRRGKGNNSNKSERKRSQTKKQSSRPCAPVAQVPPKSPVYLYRPNKVSLVKVQSKLAKKIARRSAARKQRKSKREFTRFKQKKATKTTMLPTSPPYEVMQHMTSKSLEKPFAFETSEEEMNEVPLQGEVELLNDETIDHSSAETKKIVILISSGVYEYTQKAQINETLALFNDLQIKHENIDGMDPLERDIRNRLFEISGIRGCYPQIFCSSVTDGNDYKYLGGYDWLQSTSFEDLRSIIH